jgi:hypothetical protein
MELRRALIRLAHTDANLRPHLLAILKQAEVFPTQKALETYLDAHPGADKAKHTVDEKAKAPASKDEGGEAKAPKKPEDESGKAKGGEPAVNVKVDPEQLKARRPKIDSEDLSAYPPDATAEDISPAHRAEIADYKLNIVGDSATQAVEIARRVKEGIAKSADICKLNPPICSENLGLTRDKMPQIEGEKSVKQMLESDDALDKKKGEAMVQAGADPEDDRPVLQQMLDHLAKNGVRTSKAEVPVGSLSATQSEIKAAKVYGMADAHLKGKFDKIDDSVVVSRDGHILDGHHRWAALLAIDPNRKMKVKVVDMDMKDLLEEAQSVPGVYKADFAGEPLGEDDQKKYKEESKSRFKTFNDTMAKKGGRFFSGWHKWATSFVSLTPRQELIRLAATYPAGSKERAGILGLLA